MKKLLTSILIIFLGVFILSSCKKTLQNVTIKCKPYLGINAVIYIDDIKFYNGENDTNFTSLAFSQDGSTTNFQLYPGEYKITWKWYNKNMLGQRVNLTTKTEKIIVVESKFDKPDDEFLEDIKRITGECQFNYFVINGDKLLSGIESNKVVTLLYHDQMKALDEKLNSFTQP